MQTPVSALADVLSRNHVAHSHLITLEAGLLGDSFMPDERPRRAETAVRRERVIVVVGAGASRNACNLPLGREAAALLRKRLAHVHNDLVDLELDRLRLEYRLERDDFETQLLALARFDRPSLLEELEKLFSRRYYPSLSYEILAHLLKHRFIDAIFNFNFDEILDQAIEDEMGNGGFYRVVWDGDCREPLADLSRPNGGLRLPLYVKPHGTVSSKSSMRFTRGDYFLLPRELNELTGVLVRQLPLRLIVVGHAMNSFEFNEVIKRERPRDCQIFVLCPELTKSHENLALSPRFPGSPGRVTHVPLTTEAGLDVRFDQVWTATDAAIARFPRPRGIGRHHLITALFNSQVDAGTPAPMADVSQQRYLHDRAVIETCLAVAKAKGFVHLRQLMQSRAGRYFTLYRRASKSHGTSLLAFCERLGMGVVSGDTLRLGVEGRTRGAGPRARDRHSLIRSRKQFIETDIPALATHVCEQLAPERARRFEEHAALFRTTLRQMYEGDEVEVVGSRDDFEGEYFTDAVPLPSLAAMRLATRALLRSDWDLILCVAETGEWLTASESMNLLRRRRTGRLKLVVADTARSAEIRRALGSARTVEIRWLPWWLHNQHMTVFVRGTRPIGGILFERRLRASTIAPVYLEPTDADRAIDKFSSYWLRSKDFAPANRDPFIDQRQVEQTRRDVLRPPRRRRATRQVGQS